MTTVSAVIPAFNAAPFLHRAIESALAQTLPMKEVIVVDDGSTDATASVAANYPITLIRHERNRGLSAARNTGIRACTSEWVAFLDADDTWHPDKTQKQLQFATEEISAVCAEKFKIEGEITFEKLYWKNLWGNPSSTMMRRQALLDLEMFDETLRAVEDYNLWLRFALAGYKVKTTPQLYEYTPAENSLSSNAEKMFLGELKNIERISELAGIEESVARARKRRIRLEYLPSLVYQRRLSLARRELLALGLGRDFPFRLLIAFLPRAVLDLRRTWRHHQGKGQV